MTRRSTLGMVLLALLMEAPMHPYRMQQMIKERGQDELVGTSVSRMAPRTPLT